MEKKSRHGERERHGNFPRQDILQGLKEDDKKQKNSANIDSIYRFTLLLLFCLHVPLEML